MWKCKEGYMIAPIDPAKVKMFPVFDEATSCSLERCVGECDSEENWKARIKEAKGLTPSVLVSPMPLLNPVYLYSKERIMSALIGASESIIIDLYLHNRVTVKYDCDGGCKAGEVYGARTIAKIRRENYPVEFYLQDELFKKLLKNVDLEKIKGEAAAALEAEYLPRKERNRLKEKILIADTFLKTKAKPEWIQMNYAIMPPREFLVSFIDEDGLIMSTNLYNQCRKFGVSVKVFGSISPEKMLASAQRAKWHVLNATYSRIVLDDDYSGIGESYPEPVGYLSNLLRLVGGADPENETSIAILNSMGLDLYEI